MFFRDTSCLSTIVCDLCIALTILRTEIGGVTCRRCGPDVLVEEGFSKEVDDCNVAKGRLVSHGGGVWDSRKEKIR